MKCFLLMVPLLVFNLASADAPRHLVVDPDKGSDSLPNGPFKTIRQAIKASVPGDTIDLTPRSLPYRESAEFINRSGEPGRPITLDGHGATLDGSEALNVADWEMVSPGLYKNDHLLKTNPAITMRWYFIFDGKMSHMGRTSKGPRPPFKKVEELAVGEWTFVEDLSAPKKKVRGPADGQPSPGAFYIKIDPAKTLTDYHIEAPIRSNGVAISGRCSHLVIKNVISTHVHNDGFNIHGYTRDVYFENIKSFDCGDDGFSAHDDCEVRVDGFVAMGNSTGVANVGNCKSDSNRVFIKGCLGTDLLFIGSNSHTLSNSVVESSAANPASISGERPSEVCSVSMENVIFHRLVNTNHFRLGRGSVFSAKRVTLAGVDLISQSKSVSLFESVVAGSASASVWLWKDVRWQADHNIYDVRHLRLGNATYPPEKCGEYQKAAGEDKSSACTKVDFVTPFNGEFKSSCNLKSGAAPGLFRQLWMDR